MKTIAFIFQKMHTSPPQIRWAINEYIHPNVHRIVFIYMLKKQIYVINDPWVMMQCAQYIESEQESKMRDVRNYLYGLEKDMTSEMDVNVNKILIYGDNRCKLKSILCALNVELAVLGEDSKMGIFKSLIFKTLDEFLIKECNVPVVRVPKELFEKEN